MNNKEIIEMLITLRGEAHAVRCDSKSAVLLTETKLTSFSWVISEAIKALKEGEKND